MILAVAVAVAVEVSVAAASRPPHEQQLDPPLPSPPPPQAPQAPQALRVLQVHRELLPGQPPRWEVWLPSPLA